MFTDTTVARSTNTAQPENEPRREFKGVFIPAALWKRKDLTWLQKCILAEIDSLDKGCFASNAYLAKHMGIPERTLTNNLADLRKKKLIIDWGFNGRFRQISVADSVSSDPQHTRKRVVCLPANGNPAYPETGPIDTSIDTSVLSKESKETPSVEGAVFSAEWKPKKGSKADKLKRIRVPSDYPSEQEFDTFLETQSLDGIATYRPDLYSTLCDHKWHQWKERLEKWIPIRDWRTYVTALDEHLLQR